MWLYVWRLHTLSYYFAKLGGPRFCGHASSLPKFVKVSNYPVMYGDNSLFSIRDIMVLVCQVILIDHIRAEGDVTFQVKAHQDKMVAIDCGSGDMLVLVRQEVSQDHLTKGLCYFIGESPSQ